MVVGHCTLPFNASATRTFWRSISNGSVITLELNDIKGVHERESEFMITASETRAGVRSGSRKDKALPAKEDPDPKKERMKKRETLCLWACENFKNMSVDDRWNIAKEHKLCF